MMDTFDPKERTLALLTMDMMGFTRAVAATPPVEVARFLDAYYRLTAGILARQGGRVVKFMGDACFAVFPEERCAQAIDCALALEREIGVFGRAAFPGRVSAVGVSVHLAVVAEAELGAEGDRRYDVVGGGVNQLFKTSGGAGVRISEPVYLVLPVGERGHWRAQASSATYVHQAGEGGEEPSPRP